jgi:CheY-like chemotaxis protein
VPSAGGNILIVEDDQDVRESTAMILEAAGYSVVTAAHGEEALRQLRSSAPCCLILLDLYMPVMNGWAFRAEQLRDPNLASIPVVVVSADGAVGQRAADLGARGYVGKPIDFDRLLALVGAHC